MSYPHHVTADRWQPITEEQAWYCLEALPPVYVPGGFAMGEPLRACPRCGDEVFTVVKGKIAEPQAREVCIRAAKAGKDECTQ